MSDSCPASFRRVILATIGTDGDVFPFLAVGSALRARSLNVTLAASEIYAELARERGLDFAPLNTAQEVQEWLGHPDCWHPIKGGRLAIQWSLKFLRRHFDVLSQLAANDHTVLVAHPGLLVSRLVHDVHHTPYMTLLLQPWTIPSNLAPPRMPGLSLPARCPSFVGNAYWGLIDRLVHRVLGPGINAFRKELGLPPVANIRRWWRSPQAMVGLFPAWYAPPQSDWPAHLQLTDFPRDDGRCEHTLPESVEAFLRAGDPPIVFTFGTGMQQASQLFSAGLETCARLGARCLFLTRHAGQLPHPLPAFAGHAAFAPFGRLFPRCAAVVHHGGIGTTSQALAAGVPQLIVPFAYDQFDNAARIRRLGVGTSVGVRRRGVRQLTAALQPLLAPDVRARCQRVAEQRDSKGLEDVAAHIEALFSRRGDRLSVQPIAVHTADPHVRDSRAAQRFPNLVASE
jgi:rhamnosyltransferase subunit B